MPCHLFCLLCFCRQYRLGTHDDIQGLDLIPEMQAAIDHLHALGGALVPSKSHWYLINFIWKNGTWKYQSLVNSPGDLSMLDHTGSRVSLERIEVTEARKSLGLMMAGDGNWNAEVAFLQKASVEWRVNLQASHLSQANAWYTLTHMINCMIEYPMMATSLTKAQCKMIMTPFINAGLSASGIVCSIPRAVVWGPFRYQGLDL